MVGVELKKIVAERNLRINKGVAYGDIDGYVISMLDGAGTKTIVITTKLTDENIKMVADELKEMYLMKTFNIQSYNVSYGIIIVTFIDHIGFKKYFDEFIDRFLSKLSEYRAAKSNICPICGEEVSDEEKYRLIDKIVYHAHLKCMEERVNENNESLLKEEADKTYIEGFVGALIGAILASIVCAIFSTFSNYIVMFIGVFMIGLAIIGYDLMKGKNGKFKIPIICICAIIGVIIGALFTVLIVVIYYMITNQVPGAKISDIPMMCIRLIQTDAMKKQILINLISGICYVIFGAFILAISEVGTIKKDGKKLLKIKDLE